MKKPQNITKYWTVTEIAKKLGISRQRVAQKIEKYGVVPYRIGNLLLINDDDFKKLYARPVGRPFKNKL